jgi:hypothetical protein
VGNQPQDADQIRVSDREREQIVELLGRATSEGRLTLDEYAERAEAAYAARTRGELARLTEDLPVATEATAGPGQPGPPPAPARPAPGPSPVPYGSTDRMTAIFGDEVRKGSWLVPQRLEVKAVFGDCRIELQDAQIQHSVTVINVTAIFGSVVVWVPEGLDVRLMGGGASIFGSKISKLTTPPAPGAPVIEIYTQIAFGSVTVRPPRMRWSRKSLR